MHPSQDLIAHAVSESESSLCTAATCSVGGGTFTLQASDMGTLDPDQFVSLRIFTPTASWYYYVEYRTRYSDLDTHALIYWTPVYEASGTTGVYGYTQIVDAHGATATLEDAGLNVSETLVLDLEGTAAVVTVDSAKDGALTVTVSFVEPGSGFHEASLGIDGTLSLDGESYSVDLGGSAAETKIVALDTSDPMSLELSATCDSGGGEVTLHLHEQFPLHVVSYGADPSVGAVASVSFESCVTTGDDVDGGCTEIEVDTVYANIGGTCTLTSETATSFEYSCVSSDGTGGLFYCTGSLCALANSDNSGWYVYDTACTSSDARTVWEDCDWTNAEYLNGISCSSEEGSGLSFDLTNMFAGGQTDGDIWDSFSSSNYIVARVASGQQASITLSASGVTEFGYCGENRYLDDSSACVDCPDGTVSPANSDLESSCVACSDNEYFWSSAAQCVACDDAGLYTADVAISDDADTACSRTCGITSPSLTTVTMLNDNACSDITVDAIYSNIGGVCTLTSETATSFEYSCVSSDGTGGLFYCTGSLCALATSDDSGWYVYDTACKLSDVRAVWDDCDWTNAEYLNGISCISDGWNGHSFVLTNEAGATVSTGALSEGSEGSVDVCLSPDSCYALTVDGSDTDLSWQISFCKESEYTYSGGGEGMVVCPTKDCYNTTPASVAASTPAPTAVPPPAPTAVPTPAPIICECSGASQSDTTK